MVITIYCATNLVNGKSYIGQTVQGLDKRMKQHLQDARSGEVKTLFANALMKYQQSDWEWWVIDECSSHDEADNAEEHYIETLGTHYSGDNGYNLCVGGRGRRGHRHSDDVKMFISAMHQGNIHGFKKGQTPWNKGLSGKEPWNKGQSIWTVNDPFRRVQLRRQVSEQMKGNTYGKGNTARRRAVLCVETGEIYPSAQHAYLALAGKPHGSNITTVCTGRRSIALGFHWAYADKESHVNN